MSQLKMAYDRCNKRRTGATQIDCQTRPCFSDRWFAAGLTALHVVHTFGVYKVVELDGLASLTQLQQLELCIPASLEALQHLHKLSCLSAQVALSLPFCDDLEYEQLSYVTRIKFQVRLAP